MPPANGGVLLGTVDSGRHSVVMLLDSHGNRVWSYISETGKEFYNVPALSNGVVSFLEINETGANDGAQVVMIAEDTGAVQARYTLTGSAGNSAWDPTGDVPDCQNHDGTPNAHASSCSCVPQEVRDRITKPLVTTEFRGPSFAPDGTVFFAYSYESAFLTYSKCDYYLSPSNELRLSGPQPGQYSITRQLEVVAIRPMGYSPASTVIDSSGWSGTAGINGPRITQDTSPLTTHFRPLNLVADDKAGALLVWSKAVVQPGTAQETYKPYLSRVLGGASKFTVPLPTQQNNWVDLWNPEIVFGENGTVYASDNGFRQATAISAFDLESGGLKWTWSSGKRDSGIELSLAGGGVHISRGASSGQAQLASLDDQGNILEGPASALKLFEPHYYTLGDWIGIGAGFNELLKINHQRVQEAMSLCTRPRGCSPEGTKTRHVPRIKHFLPFDPAGDISASTFVKEYLDETVRNSFSNQAYGQTRATVRSFKREAASANDAIAFIGHAYPHPSNGTAIGLCFYDGCLIKRSDDGSYTNVAPVPPDPAHPEYPPGGYQTMYYDSELATQARVIFVSGCAMGSAGGAQFNSAAMETFFNVSRTAKKGRAAIFPLIESANTKTAAIEWNRILIELAKPDTSLQVAVDRANRYLTDLLTNNKLPADAYNQWHIVGDETITFNRGNQ